MNFLQMVQRVHSETLRSTAAPTTVVDPNERHARIINRVADAWMELQSERDWKWMRTTIDEPLIVGQQIYTATDLSAPNFGRWRKEDDTYAVLAYVDGEPNTVWPLSQWHLDELRQQWVYRVMGNSRPIAWAADEDNNLVIGPAPAEAYRLRIEYWREPSTLDDDTDVPDMPDRFHMLLVWRALQDCAKDDAAPEILSKAEKNYSDMHAKLLRDQARLPHL